MKKAAHIMLGLQALAFSMKGVAVTDAERVALKIIARRCLTTPIPSDYVALRDAALDCVAADPLTDDLLAGLTAALAGLLPDKTVAQPAWLSRKDING